MSWIVAAGAGVGLGLVYFGGLWLTVCWVVSRPATSLLIPLSSVVRLAMVGAGLVVLSRYGSGGILAALVGLRLSQWCLLRRWGGLRDGR